MSLCIGFIGAGNMAQSIMGGLLKQDIPGLKLCASAQNQATLNRVQQLGPIHTSLHNQDVASMSDVIILAVKPDKVRRAMDDIAPILHERVPLLISVASGIRISTIQRHLSPEHPIIRVMPNTPALLRMGASGMFANAHVSQEQRQQTEEIFNAIGTSAWVDQETQIDTVTALSGSGPAYFFLLIEAMIKAGRELGLSEETAHHLTTQTAVGAANMALRYGNDGIEELRKNVTSPGGTTEAGLKVFTEAHFEDTVAKVVRAAEQRAKQQADET